MEVLFWEIMVILFPRLNSNLTDIDNELSNFISSVNSPKIITFTYSSKYANADSYWISRVIKIGKIAFFRFNIKISTALTKDTDYLFMTLSEKCGYNTYICNNSLYGIWVADTKVYIRPYVDFASGMMFKNSGISFNN